MPDLTPIAAALQTLFSQEAVQLAHQTGLVRRHSKLSGPLILLVLVAGFIQHPTATYNILAQVAYDYGVVVTRQAIHQRLTPAAITFFRLLLDRSLQLLQARCLPIPLLTQFSAVYLLDSSQVALPPALITQYPGTGGDGPQAGIKWQVLWELLSGNLLQVLGQPAKQSDHQYCDYSDIIAPSKGSGNVGSLMLFDLGYVALPRLQQLDAQNIYFICRWNPRFEAFTTQGLPFDLRVYLAHCARCGLSQVDLNSRVGVRAQMSVRVVAFRLPAQVCEQRRRRARQTERKRGFSYTAEYKAMLEWNVYVTNVPVERLTAEQVSRVYRLRWQVELLFKLWKMQGALDEMAGRKEGRVMCELYAKLIGMAVFGYLTAPVRLVEEGVGTQSTQELREWSPSRAWQVWQRQIERIGQALRKGREGELMRMLRRVYELWEQFGRKDKRKNRPTSFGQLQAETVASETSEAKELPLLPAIITTAPKKRIRRRKQEWLVA